MQPTLASALVFLALAVNLVSSSYKYDRVEAVKKTIQAKNLQRAGLPDPMCRTGVLSVPNGSQPQVCCASYCGECSDYPTCANVRGQDSAKACCASQVFEQRCGNAIANVCLKPCTESVPPCILESGQTFTAPDPNMRHAADDCDTVVADWRAKAEAAMNPASVAAAASVVTVTAPPIITAAPTAAATVGSAPPLVTAAPTSAAAVAAPAPAPSSANGGSFAPAPSPANGATPAPGGNGGKSSPTVTAANICRVKNCRPKACCIRSRTRVVKFAKPNNQLLDACVAANKIWCRQGGVIEKKGRVKVSDFV